MKKTEKPNHSYHKKKKNKNKKKKKKKKKNQACTSIIGMNEKGELAADHLKIFKCLYNKSSIKLGIADHAFNLTS